MDVVPRASWSAHRNLEGTVSAGSVYFDSSERDEDKNLLSSSTAHKFVDRLWRFDEIQNALDQFFWEVFLNYQDQKIRAADIRLNSNCTYGVSCCIIYFIPC